MVKLRGWHDLDSDGIEARGRFYSRFKDRVNKKTRNNVEFVDKHNGEVYEDVRRVDGVWRGVGRPIAVEPRYRNLNGFDQNIKRLDARYVSLKGRLGPIKSKTILSVVRPLKPIGVGR